MSNVSPFEVSKKTTLETLFFKGLPINLYVYYAIIIHLVCYLIYMVDLFVLIGLYEHQKFIYRVKSNRRRKHWKNKIAGIDGLFLLLYFFVIC